MTSSTKPEVHNISHCRQRRTKVTYNKNFVKFGRVDFEKSERTKRQIYRHTDTLITIHCTPTRGGG